jgi:nucleoside-diphosphate-sugar epimerase
MNCSREKALVTGGSGFIGRYFIKKLIRSDLILDISVGQRSVSVADIELDSKIDYFYLDLSESIKIEQRFDLVFHIASEKSVQSNMWNVNFEGTRRLLDWAVSHGVKRFVYLSSVGVYGSPKNTAAVKIESDKKPNGIYEESKSRAEDLVIEKCIANNIEYVILQPSNVIGWAFGASYPLLGLMNSVKRNLFTYFGNMRSTLNYVAVEDVALALVASIAPKAANSIFIINSPIFTDQMIEWISQELSVPTPTRRFPQILGVFSAYLADKLNKVTSFSIPFGKERYNEITNTTVYDGLAIQEKINFSYPHGIETSIRGLTRKYINEGI